jgi:hypothetical protein
LRSVRSPLSQRSSAVLEATSMGRAARERLLAGERGVVDGAFDGAINVRLSRGLVCVVPHKVGMGPLNVTLRLPAEMRDLSSLGLRQGDPVRTRRSCFELGGRYRVDFRSASVYSPNTVRPTHVLSDDRIAANLEVARETAVHFGKMTGLGGLLALLGPGTSGEARRLNLFASAAVVRIMALDEAFRSGDGGRMDAAVEELVGLGPGLTPSSDDMLAGVALFCCLYSRGRPLQRRPSDLISRAIEAKSPGRTTRLSAEFLVQAALGNGNEAATGLCDAVLTAKPCDVEERTRAVLTIGETSGTDIALGVVLGGMMCTGGPLLLAERSSR